MDDRPAIPAGAAFRAFGTVSALDRIGAGFSDKSGVRQDQTDRAPPVFSLVYVLNGRGAYQAADGRRFPLAPGWCFLRVPGRRHTTTIDPAGAWREAWVDLGLRLWQALDATGVIPAEPPCWEWGLTPARVARFRALRRDLERGGLAPPAELYRRALALVLDAQAAVSTTPSADAGAEAVLRALAEHPEQRLDLGALCRRHAVDYERFRKDFQRRTGLSPMRWRIRQRMERACALLHEPGLTLAAIADRLGYADPYEFGAQFRRWMGMPPGRYRRTAGGGPG